MHAVLGQVRAAYVDKVSGKIGDLFRGYWAIMDRLEVGGGILWLRFLILCCVTISDKKCSSCTKGHWAIMGRLEVGGGLCGWLVCRV